MAASALRASQQLSSFRVLKSASVAVSIFGGRMGKHGDRSAAHRGMQYDEDRKKHSRTTVLSSKTKCASPDDAS